jgi:hypothetical protein
MAVVWTSADGKWQCRASNLAECTWSWWQRLNVGWSATPLEHVPPHALQDMAKDLYRAMRRAANGEAVITTPAEVRHVA